jgi:hypothetical protein
VAALVLSVVIAVLLAHLGVFAHLLTYTQGFNLVGAFIAGIFFTSMFTAPAAAVAFVEIGTSANLVPVALVGAIGAVFGDMLLFLFIRDNLAADLREILNSASYRKLIAYFHGGFFRWVAPILGAIIIASPLPDELALGLMGMSRMRSGLMVPVTFLMNFLGILLILTIIT